MMGGSNGGHHGIISSRIDDIIAKRAAELKLWDPSKILLGRWEVIREGLPRPEVKSVFRGALDCIDHQNRDRSTRPLELEAELILHCRKDRRHVGVCLRIGRAGAAGFR